jgi:hypothetical protein
MNANEATEIRELSSTETELVSGGRFKQQGVIPGYEAPTVYYDDGITIWTSDPSTSNVAYDSPFTPIPRPA